MPQVRDLAPMQAGNVRRWNKVKAEKAISTLVELGWTRTITEHGLTLTEPRREEAVKTPANG